MNAGYLNTCKSYFFFFILSSILSEQRQSNLPLFSRFGGKTNCCGKMTAPGQNFILL